MQIPLSTEGKPWTFYLDESITLKMLDKMAKDYFEATKNTNIKEIVGMLTDKAVLPQKIKRKGKGRKRRSGIGLSLARRLNTKHLIGNFLI